MKIVNIYLSNHVKKILRLFYVSFGTYIRYICKEIFAVENEKQEMYKMTILTKKLLIFN